MRAAVTPPEPADVMRLLAEADPDLACFLRVAAVTGARRSELCALKWSDLDAEAGTVVISRSVVGRTNDALSEKTTKTGTGRRIALDGPHPAPGHLRQDLDPGSRLPGPRSCPGPKR